MTKREEVFYSTGETKLTEFGDSAITES